MAVAMGTLEAYKPEEVEDPQIEVEKQEIDDGKEEGAECMEVEEGEGSKSSKKRRRTATPVDRPSRERKTAERYTEWVSKGSVVKQISIEKGPGTQLNDIPNVAYNLSKRKPDDTLKSLHCILFGKPAAFDILKKNIGMFSGYAWAENEQEKQREKVKEKLDKYVREKLFNFCDVLNIQAQKSLKKEEVILKLLEFLESPCVTTKVLLADKEQKSKKRKAKRRSRKTPSKKQSGNKSKRTSSTKEEDESLESENGSMEDDDKDSPPRADSEEEDDEEEEYQPKKNLSTRKQSSKKNIKRGSMVQTSKISKEQKNTKTEEHLSDEDNGSMEKELSHSPAKKQEKGNENSKEPTNKELRAVVVKMLKEVDFDSVTISDILKQLASHFGVDLRHKKAEAKAIIADVIDNMVNDEDKEEEEVEDGVRKMDS